MSHPEQEEGKKIKVTVKDKRRSREAEPSSVEAAAVTPSAEGDVPEIDDYLDDLRRLQADFENYRKRMMRDVAQSGARAKASVVEKLLPVLDNFERAIAHGEGGEGVALVFRELKEVLSAEGLEEVPAEGEPFDPNVHEAVMSEETDSVDAPTVKEVYRRGYRFGDQLLRAAMVVVARPADEPVPEAAGE